MNETLKRRLVGLAVILLGLLLLSLILPGPRQASSDGDGLRRVTLDLRASAPSTQLPPPVTPIPPVIEAPTAASTPEPDAGSVADTEPDLEVPAQPERASAVTTKVPAVVAKPPAPVARPRPVAPKKAVPAAPAWYVQLGAFSDVAKARQLLQGFKDKSYPGLVSPTQTSKGVMYRVWIGPYRSHDLAAAAQKRLGKSGAAKTTLIQG